ncbi:hypothetical protein APR12_001037 [Nocardia amikacinitolerans]|uniref:DUF1254 domain-containing protein n=1 Tax=Nocardia amikacinitolerans TaxID=756689 RepID=UPI000A06FFCD|nr:DUF1254 domain-containing protein [Nocardia amikacinitolerans]MCP2315704.1 hypothetical protein [Nocardia amikacinitolerans]
MRFIPTHRLAAVCATIGAVTVLAAAGCGQPVVPSTAPPFTMDGTNYPSDDTSRRLTDELTYQRAVQAYIWAQPLVGLAAMRQGAQQLGIAPLQTFIFDRLQQVNQKLQTGNDDVVYSFAYFDLSHTGPLVVEIPPSGQYGVLLDAWQRPIEDVGGTGPDAGVGGRYLIVPPGYAGPVPDAGYHVRTSQTNTGMLFLRAVRKPGDPIAPAAERLKHTNLYPYAAAAQPPAPNYHLMGTSDYDGLTPKGMDYFDLLASMVATEVTQERDRVMLGMLASLGIEPGKPFQPDSHLEQILVRAADTGRKMVANLEFNPDPDRRTPYPKTQWRNPTGMRHYSQERGALTEIDERAALFRFGFAMQKFLDPAAKPPVGTGGVYLTSFRDAEGNYLDGSEHYVLRVPPNPPVEAYWSASVYDAEDFSFIATDQRKPSVSSLKDLVANPDGSIDVFFGPSAPKQGSTNNWIKTVPGQGFLVLFRLYGPTEDYYKGTWPFTDITKTTP